MHTPPKLEGPNLVSCRNLEVKYSNRAGIIKRDYHCSVYKIDYNDLNWYVAAEGASPLLTYLEAMECNPDLKFYQKEISNSFYKTLRTCIWNDLRLRHLCDIIHFDGLSIFIMYYYYYF